MGEESREEKELGREEDGDEYEEGEWEGDAEGLLAARKGDEGI